MTPFMTARNTQLKREGGATLRKRKTHIKQLWKCKVGSIFNTENKDKLTS